MIIRWFDKGSRGQLLYLTRIGKYRMINLYGKRKETFQFAFDRRAF